MKKENEGQYIVGEWEGWVKRGRESISQLYQLSFSQSSRLVYAHSVVEWQITFTRDEAGKSTRAQTQHN